MRTFVNSRQYKWLPWLIIGMAVGTITTVILALHYVESRLVASRGESLALVAAEIAGKLDLFLAERLSDVRVFASTPLLQQDDTVAIKTAYLQSLQKIHPVYLWLGITDMHGRIVAATNPTTIGEDRNRSPWFRAARDGKFHAGDIEPFAEAGGTDALSLTAPIRDTRGRFSGTITTRVGLPVLEEVLTFTIQAFRTREEFAGSIEYQFMNHEGTALIDSDLEHKGNVNLKQLALPSALLSESGQPGYVEEMHQRRHAPVITGYAQTREFGQFPDLKWTILVRMDQSDLLTPIRKVLWTLGALSLLFGGPLFIVLVWSTTRLKEEWGLAQEEHARAALAEAKYCAMLESTGEGVCGMSQDGRLTFINSAGATKLGYLPEELLGRRVHDLLHHSHQDGSPYPFDQCPVTHTIRTGKSCILENEVLWRRDGTAFPAKYSAYPIERDGQIMGAVVIFSDISERQRADEALRTNEQRMRAILDGALDAVVGTDEQGVITDWNPQAEAIFGWSRSEAIGQSLAETLIPSRYRERHHHGMKHFLATGEGPLLNRRIEITALRRDGTEFPVELTISALKDEAAHRFTAFIADITERKRAENALRESEARLKTVQRATNDVTWEWDLTTDALWLSDNVLNLFGYQPNELTEAAAWAVRLHPDDKDRITSDLYAVIQRKHPFWSGEYRFRRADGSYASVYDRGYINFAESGAPIRMTGAMMDITERKQAEEALRESEKRFRTIFDQAPLGMAVINSASGKFRRINQKYCEIVGYPHKEMLTRTFQDITHPDDLQADLDNMTRMMEGRIHNFQMEKRYIRKDGAVVWVNLMCVPLWWDNETDGRFHIAMVKDITERKQAEAALRERSRQQAIEAELSLLAVTAPDLPNLLNATIKAVADVLRMDHCKVLQLLPNGKELLLRAGQGWKEGLVGHATMSTGLASQAGYTLLSNVPVVVENFQTDTRFTVHPLLHDHGIVSGLSFVIHGKDEPWGILGAYTTRQRSFSRNDVDFFRTVSNILATAIERMQTEDVLRHANQTLRTLSRQLLQVQEEDRRTIARDLHDEIGQSLTAIKLNVERAQRTSDRAARDRIMKDCVQITDSVLNQVRNLSLDLHPSILDDLGLSYALKWYADRQAERAGLKVEVTADPSGPRLPQDVEIACFRIAQEALTNVVRHAQASRASITLKRLAKRVELRIQDDGIGFDVKTAQSPMGGGTNIGLTGMRERARLAGGEVHVTSVLQKGTTVTAIVPLPSVPSADTTTPQVPAP